MNSLQKLWRLPRTALMGLITAYQYTLSPDHGPLKALYPYGYCPHEPTCSQYAKEVVGKRGVMIGSLLTFKRVMLCMPWSKPSAERILRL